MTEMLMSKSNIGEKEVSGLEYLDCSKAQSWRRCGRGEPSPGADVAGASPVPVQMRQRASPL